MTIQQTLKMLEKTVARLDLADNAHWYDKAYLLCEDRRALTETALADAIVALREHLKNA